MTNRRNFIKAGALVPSAGLLLPGQAAAQTRKSYPGSASYAARATPKPWTVPQRKGPPISIDVHSHWAPEPYLKAKAELGQPDFLAPINHDLDRRRKWMDQNGVQTLVLTLGGFRPWVWVTPEQGAHISRVTNDAAMQAHTAFPDRFLAGIELNCSDPVGSLAELNRVAGKPGMVCVHLPTSLAGRDFMLEPEFAPVLARTQELGLPILLHPLDGEANWFHGKRLADAASGVSPAGDATANRFPGLTNSLGNSLEVSVAMAKMMTSGLLDNYPKLDFIICCCGGAMPFVAGRMENRGGQRLKQPVYNYLRRFHYDSLTYWPESMRFLAEMVGADRIVLGSDNMFGPGQMMMDHPHSLIDQVFNDQDRELILRGNLTRLFKL